MHNCTHDGFHSGEGRYDRRSQTVRYVMVCDACRTEVREVLVQPYVPDFDAHGNDTYVSA